MIFPFSLVVIFKTICLVIFCVCCVFFIYFNLLLVQSIYTIYDLIVRPLNDYSFAINNKKDFFKMVVKLWIVFLGIISLFSLRLFRRGYYIDWLYYKEYIEIIYYSRNEIQLLIWLYLLTLIIFLIVIVRMLMTLCTYRIKNLFMTLHVYLLQFEYYNVNVRYYLSNLNSSYFMLYYNILDVLFKKEQISMFGIFIYRYSLFLEKLIYKLLLVYLYIFDIITNFGVISTVFYVLPYYFLYGIIRIALMTWFKWFVEMGYTELSLLLYKKHLV